MTEQGHPTGISGRRDQRFRRRPRSTGTCRRPASIRSSCSSDGDYVSNQSRINTVLLLIRRRNQCAIWKSSASIGSARGPPIPAESSNKASRAQTLTTIVGISGEVVSFHSVHGAKEDVGCRVMLLRADLFNGGVFGCALMYRRRQTTDGISTCPTKKSSSQGGCLTVCCG